LRLPLFVFIFGAIPNVIVEARAAMLTPAVSIEQQERRAVRIARTLHRFGCQLEGLFEVVAVTVHGKHPMCTGDVGQGPVRLTLTQRRVDRIQVVLANEDHGKFVQRGEICAFVKHAFLDRGVADEGDGYLATAFAFVCEGAADSDWDRTGNDGNARHHALFDVHEVHGPAPAANAASGLAADLGEHTLQIAALGEIVRMTAMGAVNFVSESKGFANADGRRFLSNRKMHRAAHLTFGVVFRNGFLDQPDPQHLAVDIHKLLGG